MMTSTEKYLYDINGFLYVRNAISVEHLKGLNAVADRLQQQVPLEKQKDEKILDIVNREELVVPLIDNPSIIPYVDEMMTQPRLKSTWLTFTWPGYGTDVHSNHVPTRPYDHYVFNNGIHHYQLNVFYALKDIETDCGALDVMPGSHKANFPMPGHALIKDQMKKLTMKAGDALLFTHDMFHGSRNIREGFVRRVIIFSYAPGCIANSFGDDSLYDRLHALAPQGSWSRYLLRRPHGYLETEKKPVTEVPSLATIE